MKRFSFIVLALTAIAQLAAVKVFSQKEKNEKQEKQEIIIRKKGKKNEKITIVIEGDKITVNGKPIEKGNKDIIVEQFDGDMPMIMHLPKMPNMAKLPRFDRFEGIGNGELFMKDFHFDMKDGALLGVVTNENEKGAEVQQVMEETSAEKAGLQKGDIIMKVDEEKIANPSDLAKAISKKKPKDNVAITYLRNGKETTAKAQLGESKFPNELLEHKLALEQKVFQDMGKQFQDKQFEFQFKQPWNAEHFNGPMMWMQRGPQLGATIQDTEEGNGVKVLDTDKDSPAEKNGLLKDDLITEINGKKVSNVNEAREALHQKNENNSWNLKVLRAGKTINMEIKIPKKLNKADL